MSRGGIDRAVELARCSFRPIPLVAGSAGDVVEEMENAKGIPESPKSLGIVAVP